SRSAYTTPGAASIPRSCRTCSIASVRPTAAAPAPTAGSVSGSRSCGSSSSSMAARCAPRARAPIGARRSRSGFRGRGPRPRRTRPASSPSTAPARPRQLAFNGGHADQQRPVLLGMRLLVVEDEEDGREALTLFLSRAGAQVRSSTTVQEARRVLEQWLPDVVVTDIGLPGDDGYAL